MFEVTTKGALPEATVDVKVFAVVVTPVNVGDVNSVAFDSFVTFSRPTCVAVTTCGLETFAVWSANIEFAV